MQGSGDSSENTFKTWTTWCREWNMHTGGTFSGIKTHLGAVEQDLLGHRLTIEGQMPEENHISKVLNWGPCKDLSDVCVFLGMIGVCRMFIKNFTHRAHHLVRLTCKGTEWEFGWAQLEAMDDLKDALKNSTALPAQLHIGSPNHPVGRHFVNCNQLLISAVWPSGPKVEILCEVWLNHPQQVRGTIFPAKARTIWTIQNALCVARFY